MHKHKLANELLASKAAFEDYKKKNENQGKVEVGTDNVELFTAKQWNQTLFEN